METVIRLLQSRGLRWAGATLVALICLLFLFIAKPTHAESERVISIFHDGIQQTVVTDATTVDEALKRANVSLDGHDAVEPDRATKLTAPSYDINVYRAKPVMIIDSASRYEVMSPHTSARQIAADAGLTLYDEDRYQLTRIDDFIAEGGVGLKMTIQRAVPITFVLYGKPTQIRTQSKTVGDLLAEKQVALGDQDGTSASPSTPIVAGMSVDVWRNGAQTVTEEQAIGFTTKYINDADKPITFRQVQTSGVKGKKLVTYQVELKNGQIVSRKEIQSVTVDQPKEQVEVIGAKPGNGLSRSKGVNFYVDSRGVGHRETYYDLVMSKVMGNCGGTYSARADGVKVDQDGYILVAANLSRYPRCSVVETSLGAGKVYDTGGFVTTYPDGFDLATDWSNNDGR
jgi:uncharacterized protein YabE (DUF348 family)